MKIYSGTTLFSLIANHSIVVAADSLAGGKDAHIETLTKLRVIGKSVIACEGMGALQKIKTGLVYYRADEWMQELERNLPVKADAFAIARAIATTHPFIEIFKVELQAYSLIAHNDKKGYLAEFLVASAAGERFSLLTVRARVDHEQWTVAFKTTTHFDGPPPQGSFFSHSVGRIARIKEALGGKGDAYQDMLLRTNGSFGRLLRKEEVSLDELREIARSALALEAEANRETVGPPFTVAALRLGEPAIVTSHGK